MDLRVPQKNGLNAIKQSRTVNVKPFDIKMSSCKKIIFTSFGINNKIMKKERKLHEWGPVTIK